MHIPLLVLCAVLKHFTLSVGTYDSGLALQEDLDSNRFMTDELTRTIVRDLKIAKQEATMELVVVSVSNLGFPNGATLPDIYRAAEQQGLKLCPAEVGPMLRLHYPEQPIRESLTIAMKPVHMLDGYSHVFKVMHGHRWIGLTAEDGSDTFMWLPSDLFVFQVARASQRRGFCLHLPHENGRVIAWHARGGAGARSGYHGQLAA